MRRVVACSLLLLAGTLVVGCKKKDKGDDEDNVAPEGDDDIASVEDGSDTAAAESDAELVTSSLVTGSPGSIGLASTDLSASDLGSRAFGDNTVAIYFPRGCLVVTNDAAAQTATYKFTRCMGPNGLRGVTGEVKARYRSDGAGHLHLDLSATDLALNRASVDWSASADITESGADRTMTWSAQLAGTTARGRTFDRWNRHTISWKLGEPCFALDGTSTGDVNGRAVHTEIQGFRRCRRACPDPGGKIVITNVTKNKRFELRYDGSNQAKFIDPKGNEATIPLLCASQ